MNFYNPREFALDNDVSEDQFERALVDMVKDKPILLARVQDVLKSQYNITYTGKLKFGIEKLSQVKISESLGTQFLILAGSRGIDEYAIFAETRGGGKISNKPYIPFCVGWLRVNHEPSATGLSEGWQYQWVVGEDAHRQSKKIQITDITPNQFVENEFVCVCEPLGKKDPFVCAKHYNMQPIQVLPWSNFVQSDEEDSAVSFLSKNPQGALSYKRKSVFGNKQSPSQILIYDAKKQTYLKGFSAYASDDIRYTNVYEFDGEFRPLATANQAVEYNFSDGNQFSVLVPLKEKQQADRTRHAVLDDSRWKVLGSVGDSFETKLAQICLTSPIPPQTEEATETAPRLDGEQTAPGGVVVDVSHNLDEAPHETVESTSVEDVSVVQVLPQEAEADESGMRDEDVQPQEEMGQSPEASYSLQINKLVKQIIRTINEELGKDPNSECDLARISSKYIEYFDESLNAAVKKGTDSRYFKIGDYLRSQSSVFDVRRRVGSTETYVKSREDLANMPLLSKHSGGAQAFNNSYSRWKALGSVGDSFEPGLAQIRLASPIPPQTEEVAETAPRFDGEQNALDGVVVDGSSNFDEGPYETVESSPVEDVEPVYVSPSEAEVDESGNREEDVQPQEKVEHPLETSFHEDTDKECAFLRAFHEGVQKAGFHYNLRDIVRFHTSLKCCPFTLLGGAPGTGKSSLVTLYAKALLGSNYKESNYKGGYLPIDVSSSWTDPEDLFGYWDMNGNYRVAASGIVPFMWDANKSGKTAEEGAFLPRIICFEEMNLARVEHYFSNMIQVLSRPVSERVLKGIPSDETKCQNKKGETQCQNQAKLEPGNLETTEYTGETQRQNQALEVAENLRFIGTCNFDETTQAFSARFYDRCSYLELSPVENKEPFSGVIPNVANYDAEVSLNSYRNAYKAWHRASGEIDVNVKETYKTIQQNFRDVGVYISPRVETQIRLYILNRPNIRDEKNDDKESQMLALDEAIVQMVLPQVCRTSCPYDGNERLKKVMGICEKSNLDLCKQFLQSQLNQFETPERV